MRLANTPDNRKGTVGKVDHAIRVVTPAGIETLARRIATYGFFERMHGWELPPEDFRLHSVAVAGTVDLLARELHHPHRDELLVAAMLHDIGKVVMAEAYPGYAERMFDSASSPGERSKTEREEYGVDHALIGGVLLRRWRLPQLIARAVERHHAPDARNEAAVLRLGDMLAHYEGGDAVRPAELTQAAAGLGIKSKQLESLMYRLPDRGENRRHTVSPSPLTVKERDVLRGLAGAKVYKEIAHDLGIAASTVRSHLHSVYAKLGAVDRAQAVIVATREGWI
jgi:putative nucleotidyltransferase with HDIG domain